MKKYLPLILLGVGLLVIIGAFVMVRSRRQEADSDGGETALIDVQLSERPVVSLVPRSDGHYVDMEIEKLMVPGATTLDYDFFYTTKESEQPLGVQGTREIGGADTIEEEFLFGSVSSGTPRFDEGVDKGTLTLRFRNSDGELLIKFEADFHLQTDTDLLTSVDQVFKYELEEEGEVYFVTMNTVGYPGEAPAEVETGPYGIFSSEGDEFGGTVDLGGNKVYFWDGEEWTLLENDSSENIGIFFGSTQ